MFSKVLDNFTGVFLILYISATSATPTVQPEEANKINSTIHARAYQPYQCVDPFLWLRRECVGALGSRVWQDVCAYSANVAGAQIHYDNKEGTCPYNTYCLDNFKPSEGSRFIRCVPGNPSSTGSVLGKRKRDPQSDTKRARPDLGNTQFQYSVTIDHDMTEAAVAAVVASECRPVDVHCRRMFLYSCGGSGGSIKFR